MPTKETSTKVKTVSDKSAELSKAASTPETVTKVFPPYLRYFVPAELAQIKANLQKSLDEFHLENLAELAGQATQGTLTPSVRNFNIAPEKTDVKTTSTETNSGAAINEAPPVIRRSRDLRNVEQFVAPASGLGETQESAPPPIIGGLMPVADIIISELLAMMKQPLPTAKTAQTLTLNPVGTVQMGFGCQTTFRARTSLAKGPPYKWALFMYDGTWHDLNDGETTKTRDIDFVLDGDTYGLSAYGGNGIAKFLVVCSTYNSYGTLNGREYSEGVLLHFVNQPCIEIYNVSMNTSSVKGGDKNDWVTFTINLSSKAPPGGQAFHLSTNSNKASIHGGGTFYVAEGQTSETVSYFLGTSNVAKDHDIVITAKMNGHKGHVNLKIKK